MNTLTQNMSMKSRNGICHLGATLWLVGCLGVAALLVWRALPSAPAPAGAARLASLKAGPFAKPIEQVRVGIRVAAHNPELDDADRYFREVDAPNWRHLFLRSVKPDGSALDIQLLREVDWVEATGAAVGKDIELELEEFGAEGLATVLAIAPCPPIAPGSGRIVTGTFAHTGKRVIDVRIDSQTSIGCTDNHLFWSEDRYQFVPAGELRVGEMLRSINNSPAQVLAISPRAQSERVYNLEVDVEHAYFVSAAGILVHNSCNSYILGKDITAISGISRRSGFDAAHVIPVGKFSNRSPEIQKLLEQARDVLSRHHIGINSRINGAWVDRAMHRGYHSDRVLRKVATRIIAADKFGTTNVRLQLQTLAREMVDGTILNNLP